jgi:hypothetical protein
MSDDPVAPVEPTTPPAEPASPFNADGSFAENWQSMAPEGYEDLRDDKTLPRFKNVWEFGRSHIGVRKQVGMESIPKPNENWGESDWNGFYEAGGRPDTAGDFEINRNENIPEELRTEDMVKADKEFYYKAGFSKKQVEALEKYNEDKLLAIVNAQNQQEEDEYNRKKDTLTNKWGRAYDQKVFRGTKAIERGTKGDEGHYQSVLDLVNKHTDLIEFVANIEDLFSENSPVESSHIDTPSDLQTQIDALTNSPEFSSPVKAVRMNVVNKIMRLREQMNQDKKAG